MRRIGQLLRRQRPPIQQRRQHIGARRIADQLIERCTEFWGLFACKYFLDAAAVAFQQLQRHEQLPPRRIQRQCRDHLRDALRQSGVAREVFGLPVAREATLAQYAIQAVFLGEGSGTLELFTSTYPAALEARLDGADRRLDHVALRVENLDALVLGRRQNLER